MNRLVSLEARDSARRVLRPEDEAGAALLVPADDGIDRRTAQDRELDRFARLQFQRGLDAAALVGEVEKDDVDRRPALAHRNAA